MKFINAILNYLCAAFFEGAAIEPQYALQIDGSKLSKYGNPK